MRKISQPTNKRGLMRGRFSARYRLRNGVAELELIMVLPILIGFVFALMWTGIAMETQDRMLVQARHNAWSQRTTSSGAPFVYSDIGFASDQTSEQVKFIPMAKYFTPAKASSTIMAGAWDFRRVDLNSQPNFQRFGEVMKGAGQSAADALDGFADRMPDIQNMLQDAISRLKDAFGKADKTDLVKQLKQELVKKALDALGVEKLKQVKKLADLVKEAAKDLVNPLKLKKKIEALEDLIDSFGDAMSNVGDLLSDPLDW